MRIGHSPDPDDAFMFFPLATGAVRLEGFLVEQVLEDIESLNRRARRIMVKWRPALLEGHRGRNSPR